MTPYIKYNKGCSVMNIGATDSGELNFLKLLKKALHKAAVVALGWGPNNTLQIVTANKLMEAGETKVIDISHSQVWKDNQQKLLTTGEVTNG